MQQVYPIFKVHSGSANRNENGGRCCIRKESAVTRKKGCPGVEPDIPNDLIKRQYLNLVCGSGMRGVHCGNFLSSGGQLPVPSALGSWHTRTPLLCLCFSYYTAFFRKKQVRNVFFPHCFCACIWCRQDLDLLTKAKIPPNPAAAPAE